MTSPPKWTMIIERMSWNSLRPTMCQLKWFTPLFTRICSSQEVGQVSNQTALRGEELGVIRNLSGDHSDNCLSFLTILDNNLTFEEPAGGKERADWPQPQSGGLPEGAGGDAKNGLAVNFTEALWRQ
jgi:hypothetical protein